MPQPTDTEATEDRISNATPDTPAGDTNVSPAEGDTSDATPEGSDLKSEQDPETFPREYVQDLRSENARYRDKAKTADQLAQRLHVALVAATGRLADPTDLPFDESHLADDGDALTAAIDDLLERKPHLKSRRVVGDVGQGAGGASTDVDLAGLLRGLA